MCYRNSMKVSQGDLSYSNFSEIIDSIKPISCHIKKFYFHWRGEPTLVRYLPQAIQTVKIEFPKTVTYLFTNGSLLEEELSNKLLKSGLDHICFSVDSINETSYNTIRGGIDAHYVFKKIRKFIQLRNKQNSGTRISVNTVVLEDNLMELPDIVQYFSKLGINVNFRQESKIDNSCHSKGPCPWVGRSLFVATSGEVSPCCMDINNELSLGNLFNSKIESILSNKFAERIIEETSSEICGLPICANCGMR